MSEFQLLLSIIALTVFIIFFKQLFSGNYPKRGVDFEAKLPDENIAGVSRADKIFKKEPLAEATSSREEELLNIAKESIEKDDNIEAKKALQSLLILEPNNIEALRMLGAVNLNMNDYTNAKENFLKILELDEKDDLTHNLLANILHKLGEDEQAIEHYKRAIELDKSYAPYYFNYANTLYDLGRKDEALAMYEKALEFDNSLEEAKKMISELKNGNN